MTCLQLYSKETEGSPGESAASSISSRHLNSQGGSALISCKTQVSCPPDDFDGVTFEAVSYTNLCFLIQFQDRVRRLCAWRDLMVSS